AVTVGEDQMPFRVSRDGADTLLQLQGDWTALAAPPEAAELLRASALAPSPSRRLRLTATGFHWDSGVAARLFSLARLCEAEDIPLDTTGLPEHLQKLLALASAVKNPPEPHPPAPGLLALGWNACRAFQASLVGFLAFLGELVLALGRVFSGRGQAKGRDLLYFVELGGPRALGIVALISVLVGMILAYLGAVQLRQLGAEVYVANLVALGMVREMAPLMTAVIMAGRTGAAYAAQLGTMQANEEIDAVTTLGLSPMEYLVVPRLLALVLVMPFLVIFANMVGLVGGALVAMGMDVSFTQFITRAREAVSLADVATGLVKSLLFAVLIAIAGCQAGLQSGRTSAAVGDATTRAVVHAIVYLVIADAALNILYNLLGV